MLQSSASTIRYPLLSLREQKGDGDIPDFPEYNISFYSTSNGLKNLLLSKIMAKSKCLPLPGRDIPCMVQFSVRVESNIDIKNGLVLNWHDLSYN